MQCAQGGSAVGQDVGLGQILDRRVPAAENQRAADVVIIDDIKIDTGQG